LEGGVFLSKRKFVLFALVAALVLGLAGSAMAATWEGPEGGLWSEGGHWDTDNAPDEATAVIIPAGSRIRINAAAEAESITFEAPDPDTEADPTELVVDDVLTIGNDDNGAGAPDNNLTKITVNHIVNITGDPDDGSIVIDDDNDGNGVVRNINVGNGSRLSIGVPIGVNDEITTISKTGAGRLELGSDVAPAATPILTIANGGGELRLTHPRQAATQVGAITPIIVGTNSTLVLGGDFDLDQANGARHVAITGTTSGVVIEEGVTVTTGATAASFSGANLAGWPLEISGTLRTTNAAVASFASNPSVTVNGATDGILINASANTILNSLEGTGAVELQANLAITPAATTPNFEFGGAISGAGNLTYTSAGTTTFTLAGASTYTGNTVIAQGTLILTADDNIVPASAVNVATVGAGTLRVNGDVVLRNNVTTGANAATINVPADSKLELRGTLAVNAAGAVKAGDGELILSGNNAAAASAFTVNGGTLTISGHGADGVALTIGALGRLRTTPGLVYQSANAVTFGAIGATFVADVTGANKFRGDTPGTPYFTVGAGGIVVTPGNAEAIDIVLDLSNLDGEVSAGDRFLVFDTHPAANPINHARFRVAEGGRKNNDYEVENYVGNGIVNGLLVRSTVSTVTPVITAPAGPVRVTPADLAASYTIGIPVTSASGGLAAATARITGAGVDELLTATPAFTGNAGTVTLSRFPEALAEGNYNIHVTATALDADGFRGRTATADFGFVVAEGEDEEPAYAISTPVLDDTDLKTITFEFRKGGDPDAAVVSTAFSYTITAAGAEVAADDDGAVGTAAGKATITLDEALVRGTADITYTLTIGAVEGHPDYAGKTGRFTLTGTQQPKGNGGGGCDAGFGLFGLLAATGAVALLRRKG
jgi:autotransporter-associated beta strand protein